MTTPTSPKPHTPTDLSESKDVPTTLDNGALDATFPPDLIEAAARALWMAAQEVNGLAEESWDVVSGPHRESWRHEARAVLSVVAGPLRAEGWERGIEDFGLNLLRPLDENLMRPAPPNPFEES